MTRPPLPRWLKASSLGAGLVCLFMAGCGEPATEAECQELAQHIARLRLKSRGFDAEEIERRVAAAKDDPDYQKTMEGCVGKRITQSSLECVRQAQTPEEVKQKCAR